MKKTSEDIIILHLCTKNRNHMMFSSWDMMWDRQDFLSLWVIFCPFTSPLKWSQKSIFWQNEKKMPGDISLLHTWDINEDHMIYGYWNRRCDRQNFFAILVHFLPFHPLTTWKIKTFEKLKKTTGCIIILHMYTSNGNHMMYGSWDMDHNGQNVLSFWTIICPFTPLTTWKLKILKKWKNT